ncbi:MAG: type II toxin-antitoxin system RelE/ParE family toxin [Alcanivorax sp.]|nr:type II toxin-antitoxin system RelE/ParE family toxin [Alcanivorax sp.]
MVYIDPIESVLSTPGFHHWLRGLKDAQGKAHILARLRRLSLGNPGDIKQLGGSVYELRIHTGPGYRIYLTRRNKGILVLLAGGIKATQRKDIRAAQSLARQYREEP